MSINELFDKIYCINLDHRKDRWEEAQAQFKKAGLKVERLPAVNGNPMGWKHVRDTKDGFKNIKPRSFDGAAGCMASHTNIWKHAQTQGYKSVLIIEDDCDFRDNLQTLFTKYYTEVPKDWDLLYLGGVHKTSGGKYIPQKVSKHILKCTRMITTTCYAIKDTCYDLALNTVLDNEPIFHAAIDGYLAAYIQPHCNAYTFNPPLAWQRAGFSDIQNGYRDYKWMKDNNTRA